MGIRVGTLGGVDLRVCLSAPLLEIFIVRHTHRLHSHAGVSPYRPAFPDDHLEGLGNPDPPCMGVSL